MIKKIITILSLLYVISSCSNCPKPGSSLVELAYSTAKEEQPPLLSTLVSDIRYIPLETSDATLGNYFTIALTDRYIIADTSTGCHVFNKKDGKYIRTVGIKDDQGPMGHKSATSPLCIVDNKIILKGFGGEFKLFSIENGSLINTISGEENLKNDLMYDETFLLNDSTMLLYSNNIFGNNKTNLQIRTYSGRIVKRFPSTNNFTRTQRLVSKTGGECTFYSYHSQVHVHEFTCDTIYRIDKETNLVPCYTLGLKDALPPANSREPNNWKEHYIKFGNMVETDRYLILERGMFSPLACIYDKVTGKTIRVNRQDYNGFKNDIDGFISFWPQSRGTGTASDEVWDMWTPEEFLQYAHIDDCHPLMKIREEDNPIVVIGTVKEFGNNK